MPKRIGTYKHPNQVSFEQTRPNAARRGYDRAWREGDREKFARLNPLCVRCLAAGRIVPMLDVDHIIPKSKGGLDHSSNYQSLCHECHSRKTGAEDSRSGRSPRGPGA